MLRACLFIAISLYPLSLRAQAYTSDFVHGRDYVFDRLVATRKVHDADDNGTIRLVTYVWKPLKNDRHEVILFHHGSTGAVSPKEPGNYAPPPQLIRYFVSHGYTLVSPMRRGRGESTGTYVEECAILAGECTTAQQIALTDRGLREALADTKAVMEQLILGHLVARDARIIVAGHSRGGFLALIMAGEDAKHVKAAINFAGGWHMVTDRLSPAEQKERTDTQSVRLAHAAQSTKVPTIWIYAARDPFSTTEMHNALLEAWRGAGGQAQYLYITDHTLPNAHVVHTSPPLWQRQLDTFLKDLGL